MTPDELPADIEGLIENVALPWIESEEMSVDPEDLTKAGQAVRALLKAYQEQRRGDQPVVSVMGDAADDAYDVAMREDDEPQICGTCPDRVPAIIPPEGWVCPECDADWSMADDDDAIRKATGEAS